MINPGFLIPGFFVGLNLIYKNAVYVQISTSCPYC